MSSGVRDLRSGRKPSPSRATSSAPLGPGVRRETRVVTDALMVTALAVGEPHRRRLRTPHRAGTAGISTSPPSAPCSASKRSSPSRVTPTSSRPAPTPSSPPASGQASPPAHRLPRLSRPPDRRGGRAADRVAHLARRVAGAHPRLRPMPSGEALDQVHRAQPRQRRGLRPHDPLRRARQVRRADAKSSTSATSRTS